MIGRLSPLLGGHALYKIVNIALRETNRDVS